MAFDSSGTKGVWAYGLGTTPKRCELQLFLAGICQAIQRYKAFHLGCFNMEFQQGCPRDKKITAPLIFLAENLEKFRSTELYGSALEGSTIFLCRSSLGCTSMESCQLADLKYAFLSRTGCKTIKLPLSKLFLSIVFKHGLLEGSTSEQMWSTVFPREWDAR